MADAAVYLLPEGRINRGLNYPTSDDLATENFLRQIFLRFFFKHCSYFLSICFAFSSSYFLRSFFAMLLNTLFPFFRLFLHNKSAPNLRQTLYLRCECALAH